MYGIILNMAITKIPMTNFSQSQESMLFLARITPEWITSCLDSVVEKAPVQKVESNTDAKS